ncbi:hypothetical protein D9M71_485220 [compost metagenome]
MKMVMIWRGVAPMVRRMAISAPLSFTTMINVAMILNAATATIISNSRPIMVFSIFMALNRLPWVWVQSSALNCSPRLVAIAPDTCGALYRSLSLRRTLCT